MMTMSIQPNKGVERVMGKKYQLHPGKGGVSSTTLSPATPRANMGKQYMTKQESPQQTKDILETLEDFSFRSIRTRPEPDVPRKRISLVSPETTSTASTSVCTREVYNPSSLHPKKSVSFGKVYLSYVEPSYHWFTRNELRKMRTRDAYLLIMHRNGLAVEESTMQHSLRGLVEDVSFFDNTVLQKSQMYVLDHPRHPKMPRRYRRLSSEAVQMAWQRAQGDAVYVHALENE